MKSEYHLFIIWELGRYKQDDILDDIAKNFDILYKINTSWSKKYFSENLTRFYGTNLPPNSFKEKHIGTGSFLVVVVQDNDSQYDRHVTSKGKKYINSRVFLSKTKYRDMTGGGHKIHATNTPAEFSHDFALLFGCSIENFLKKYKPRTKKTMHYNHDLCGVTKWKNLRQVFNILNLTDEYVVLRNFENLPDDFSTKTQGDIDILARNTEQTAYILNARRVSPENYGVQHSVKVGKTDILFDIYSIDDNHYDSMWKKRILKSKIVNQNGVSIIGDTTLYKYNLLYQNLIYKPEIPKKYLERLTNLGFSINKPANNSALEELSKYMSDNGYRVTKSFPAEYYNIDNAEKLKELIDEHALKKKFNFDSVELFHKGPHNDERRYYKATRDSEKFFVKSGFQNYEHEYNITKQVFDDNNKNFVEPIDFYNGNINYFVTKWIDGEELDEYVEKHKLTKEFKDNLTNDLLAIYKTLYRQNIVHRDLIPRNFMVVDDRLVLIDFYWAVDINNYDEYDYVKKEVFIISYLGEDFAAGHYTWDDAYSLEKIAQYISGNTSKNNVSDKIASYKGKRVVMPSVDTFHETISEQIRKNDELQKSIKKYEQKNTELINQNNELHNQVTELENQKSEMINSHSWKVTKPLRYAMKAIRRSR